MSKQPLKWMESKPTMREVRRLRGIGICAYCHRHYEFVKRVDPKTLQAECACGHPYLVREGSALYRKLRETAPHDGRTPRQVACNLP